MESINFKNDFKQILKNELDNNKVKYNDCEDLRKFMIMYYDEMRKIPIIGIKYNVYFSRELKNKMQSLPIKTQDCIKDITQRLEDGKSITTYLSKSALQADKRDNQLQNWGIYHAHVAEVSTNYEQPAKRSDLVLFFIISKDNIYFIDVKKHPKNETWFDKSLIEIIYNNWRYLLRIDKRIKKVEPSIPDSKVHDLSKVSLFFIEIQGNMVLPINMGNTTAGNSVFSTEWSDDCYEKLMLWEEEILKVLNENEKSFEVHLIEYNDGIVDIGGFKCAFSFYDGINTTIVNK